MIVSEYSDGKLNTGSSRTSLAICGLTACATLLLLAALLLASASVFCFGFPGLFRAEYEKFGVIYMNNPADISGNSDAAPTQYEWISLDDASSVTEDMLNYCRGRLDSLDSCSYTDPAGGETVLFFNNRELHHLADCRQLICAAFKLRNRLLTASALLYLLALAPILTGKKNNPFGLLRSLYDTASKTILFTLCAFLVFIAASLVFRGFDGMFVRFHELFFDNLLWIMDPARDRLIRLMTEDIFAEIAAAFTALWLAVSAILYCIFRTHCSRCSCSNSRSSCAILNSR